MNLRYLPVIRALCLGAALLVALPLRAEPAPVPVEVTAAHWQDYARPIRLSGVLENKSEQNLAFKIAGLVHRVAVDEGQWVSEGQLLAALDLEEIDAQVAKAESVLANAERNLQRFRSLQDLNALSIDQLQQAETQVDVARSDLTVARFNQRHAVIRAPADGRVLKRFVERNEMVANGRPAFLFAARKSGWVLRAGVTDRDIVRLSMNDPASVTFDAWPGRTFSAEITELAGRADASQTFEIELRIAAQEKTPLLAGFVGHAVITPAAAEQVVRLPVSAMVRAWPLADGSSEVEIFVVSEQQRAQRRRVSVRHLDHDALIVRSGLEEGERVVTTGASYLSDDRALLPAQTITAE